MCKHLIESAIGIFRRKGGKAVAEVGKRMQPRAVDAIEYADDEKRIFADRIIVFEMDGDIFGGSVLGDGPESFRNLCSIGLNVFRRSDIDANARRSEARCNLNPGLAEFDGALAFRRISRIDAVVAICGDVSEGTTSFAGSAANFVQIAGFK